MISHANQIFSTISRFAATRWPVKFQQKDGHALVSKRRVRWMTLLIVSISFLVIVHPTSLPTHARILREKSPCFDIPEDGPRASDITEHLNASARIEAYLDGAVTSNSFSPQIARMYRGIPPHEPAIQDIADEYSSFERDLEFDLTGLIRIAYLDKDTPMLSQATMDKIKDALLRFKYWFTEPGLLTKNTEIMYTENHMIQLHTSELLAGQLYPNETFLNSGMTGEEHIEHATFMLSRWLDWKACIGFTETSLTYFGIDIPALVNLVDFAANTTIATRAAMVLDLIAFDLANHFYNGSYATANGRLYNRNRIGTPGDLPRRDSIAEATWIMTGLGYHASSSKGDMGCLCLCTSDAYQTPPIIELIANQTIQNHEHKDRNGIYVEEARQYGIGSGEEDLIFWWHMAAPVVAPAIETSFNVIDAHGIPPDTVLGPDILVKLIKFSAAIHGVSIGTYASKIEELTRGVALEAQNRYVYRTPHYQLAGMQDSQKGWNCMQEHVWQASLDKHAIVWTNWDGLLSFKGGKFIGGWKPRGTFYKNVGILQYDRVMMPLALEIGLSVFDYLIHVDPANGSWYPPIHAYFPQWAFDEIREITGAGNKGKGTWVVGRKDDGYIALYSCEPSTWLSNYEFATKSRRKNAYIVELGSVDEYGSFDAFMAAISEARVSMNDRKMGYKIRYVSPSRGVITVDWDDPMVVNGTIVDTGPYDRFDNEYCHQEFGSKRTVITSGSQSLVIDFNTLERVFNETI
ncbi:hypothetical protein GF325_15880 [Candidatus Bathyarchaeota archaeon]|nr:hypothetical protein [Candidatus Bathyarchaeota archaeon]